MDPLTADLLHHGSREFGPNDVAFGTFEADKHLLLLQGPFVGVIFDRYGPRHLLLVGSLLHVLGIMMTSLGSEYYQILLAQGVCSSIGAACIFQPCKNLTKKKPEDWWVRN